MKVIELAKAMNIEVVKRDINVVHRIGKQPNAAATRPRQIIVRFVSRDTKYEIMTQKSTLKDNPTYKQMFIFEDLTLLRQRLLYSCKNTDSVSKCHTRDGAIHCIMKEGGKRVVIHSPDDLFLIGAQDVDYDDLKMSHLKF